MQNSYISKKKLIIILQAVQYIYIYISRSMDIYYLNAVFCILKLSTKNPLNIVSVKYIISLNYSTFSINCSRRY